MCSNFRPINKSRACWVKQTFNCELPSEEWREEVYPTHAVPFIYIADGQLKCELAQFGLVPPWAPDKKRYGVNTYNARSETVHQKASFRSAWKERRFGLVLMDSFYEPNWETKKSVRWCIKRSDNEPTVAASIWERIVDRETGEIIMSFSMLTINADGHHVMKHFHKEDEEKRSIVVLDDSKYIPWLHANHEKAKSLLQLTPDDFLVSEPAPIFRKQQVVYSDLFES